MKKFLLSALLLAASSAESCDYVLIGAPYALNVCNPYKISSSTYSSKYTCMNGGEMISSWTFDSADCTGTPLYSYNYTSDTFDAVDCSGKTGCGIATIRTEYSCDADEDMYSTESYVTSICVDYSSSSFKYGCSGSDALKITVYSSTGCSGESVSVSQESGCDSSGGVNNTYNYEIECVGAAGNYQPVVTVLASLFFLVFFFSH